MIAGGELAAMVVLDAVLRKLPGALGHEESAREESFSAALDGAPEYPHYTRPAEWRGWAVPEVLLSGHHARIRAWRRAQSQARARDGRRRFAILRRPPPGIRSRGVFFAMSTIIDSLERAQLRRVPSSRPATGCGSTSRSSRARAAAPRCSRAS